MRDGLRFFKNYKNQVAATKLINAATDTVTNLSSASMRIIGVHESYRNAFECQFYALILSVIESPSIDFVQRRMEKM